MNTRTLMPNRRKMRFAIALIVTAFIASVTITTPVSAEDPVPPQIPGLVQGTGTHFEVTDSEYLNVVLDSSESIDLSLYSIPEIVQLAIGSAGETTATQITIQGFSPNTKYYKYEDGIPNPLEITADATGSYTYTQDISRQHLVWFQNRISTKYIRDDATGGDCYLIGNWAPLTKTCTLTTDISETLWIYNVSGVTVDGNGHQVNMSTHGQNAVVISTSSNITFKNTLVSGQAHGVVVTNSNNVTLMNLTVSGSGTGVLIGNSPDSNLINSVITGNYVGIMLSNGQVTISDCAIAYNINYGVVLLDWNRYNTITRNNITNNGIGVFLYYDNNYNTIYNNNFIQNTKQIIIMYPAVGNIFNLSKPDGGNYFSNYDETSEGCIDSNLDFFCDSRYVISAAWNAYDNLPWTRQDGWANQPPVADAGGPYEEYEGIAINLDGSGSSDPNDNIVLYEWDLDNDGTYDDAVGQITPTIFNESGTFTVGLMVTDDFGVSDTDIAFINVLDQVLTAEFIWAPESQNEGSQVHFTDQSLSEPDEIVQWFWDFAGLSTSTEKNPSFTFMDQGPHQVCLTVTDEEESDDKVCHSVTILDLAPAAGFTWLPTTQNEGSAIQFTDQSTSDPDEIIAWAWNFGEIGTSTDQNPSFTFTDNGQYQVCLKVTDEDGSTADSCHMVTILDLSPTSAFSWSPEPENEGSAVQFTDQSTSSPDLIVSREWDFAGLGASTEQNPSFTFTDNGQYNVCLAVTDDDGSVAKTCHDVIINNVAPMLTLSGNSSVDEGSLYTLNLSAVTDPGADSISTCTLKWGDGQTEDCLDAVSGNLTHTYADGPASHTVSVDLADEDGSYNMVHSLHLTVNNAAPTITAITAPLAPVNITSQPIGLEVDFSDPGLVDVHNVLIDWGDGQSDTLNGATSPAKGTHTYSNAGVYTVQVTISDDDGAVVSELYEFIVIYDPSGGFVTGGGWVWSPAGAYIANPSLEGKATFGFVSKYLKGANVPSGSTEFQFKTGDLNFKSTVYQWLVVNKTSSNAQFKGYGTINGSGNYGFMLWAADGVSDTFRIKIWVADDETNIVYDNGISQPIGGGSIVIHTK